MLIKTTGVILNLESKVRDESEFYLLLGCKVITIKLLYIYIIKLQIL